MVVIEFFSLNEENPVLSMDALRFGPFEFVQVTYDRLRVEGGASPDNIFLADRNKAGYWELIEDGPPGQVLYPTVSPFVGLQFSDFTVYTSEER